MKYVYTIIRKDIPLADQIVQSCHSALHAGAGCMDEDSDIHSLILLEVPDQESIKELQTKLRKSRVYHFAFVEPDDDLGLTSITTGPLNPDQRKLFSNYRLWRA